MITISGTYATLENNCVSPLLARPRKPRISRIFFRSIFPFSSFNFHQHPSDRDLVKKVKKKKKKKKKKKYIYIVSLSDEEHFLLVGF